ncbi:MAG: NAD(P)H-dependent oxidoreductase [Gammaproteobacteria bacterium]|nr:NAD(P)H-dependent oxidoreductase [Gammaproteobacteria bacterium]
MNSKTQILRIDASANVSTSNSKKLGDILIEKLETQYQHIEVKQRDLNQDLYFIDESWVGANFTPLDDRTEAQLQRLAFSDHLIDEIRRADHIVLTTPMYNFGVPATLKSWIDLICRAGVTFQYTADGPIGLIDNKRVDIIITTGGVALQSPVDFVSDYLKQIFRFIGIEDINIIAADQMNVDSDSSYRGALDQIERGYGMAQIAA